MQELSIGQCTTMQELSIGQCTTMQELSLTTFGVKKK